MKYMITRRDANGQCMARLLAPTHQAAVALYNMMQPGESETVAIWKGNYRTGKTPSLSREKLIDCKAGYALFTWK